MDRIKSAYEKAMEKAERIGSATQEELLEWKWVPEGKKLAANYLKDRANLMAGLETFDEEHRPYVLRGIREVFAANVLLPRNEEMKKSTDIALKGLKELHQGKGKLEEVVGQVEYALNQYLQYGMEQQRQAYQQLKQRVEETVRQQPGIAEDNQVNAEALPEFQQEWMHISAQLDQPYEEHLEKCRKEILNLN